ncbi:tRNA synthetases class I-domain-containing protein [Mycena sp. CBHHK59/15]|nr:tRNA synthetases class I-domain-containing protein [Mycena sp. CBHHK59/15]
MEKLSKFVAKLAKPSSPDLQNKFKPRALKEDKNAPVFVNMTPKGEKKDVSLAMSAGYNPAAVESAWYDWWEAQGFFTPQMTPDGNIKPEGIFIVPAPPPNVTGSLHIGHALTTAIQDSLVRWHRMLGKTTLFVPGFDHAGISTQAVVETRLYKSSGRTRHDLGRERFLEVVLDWKDDYQERITEQLRRLGGSYDWNRTAFTMDEGLSKAVVETFCRLREGGIIYRARRLVNWCVKMRTTLSNLEVEEKALTGRTLLNVPGYGPNEKFEFGVMISFAYILENSDERIIVATTRPETMLGDTAIAVHSKDPRYAHLCGKFAIHPFLDRRIPIVMDDLGVDMAFGTGAVKITPAHDAKDYQVGERHNLEFINILNDDGTLNTNAGQKFQGMKRYHARTAVIQALKDAGLYIETKEHAMEIRICRPVNLLAFKSGDIIEPLLKPQWYVKCQPLAQEAIKRTIAGELKISPKQSETEWFRWLEDIQDWCISRQLWWGHRCPAYFVRIDGIVQDVNDDKNWVVGRTLEQTTERATVLADGSIFTLEQDEDVLDTWFSSALWPFSIMGWPEKTPDFQNFYPSTLLETGWDILFFWVARMVMLGIQLTGRVPCQEVYCHAMVRDAEGKKMSKSKGNVIDPIDIMVGISLEALHAKLLGGNLDQKEIQRAREGQKKSFPNGIVECGTDALRFALCAYSGGGRDINLEIMRVEGYRKFCNKIFNAIKFAMLKLDDSFVLAPSGKPTGNESLVERWILHKLNIAATEVNTQLTDRNFMLATNAAYNFWLYELCDVYIEVVKLMSDEAAPIGMRKSVQRTLYTCLDHGLRLLHPFMPFITEELWQRLPQGENDPTPSIMVAAFPTANTELEFIKENQQFDLVLATLKAGRSLAAFYNLQKGIQLFLHIQSDEIESLLASQLATIQALTKGCKSVTIVRALAEVPAGCGGSVVSTSITVYTLVRGLVDPAGQLAKCEKKLGVAQTNLQKMTKQEDPDHVYHTVPIGIRLANAERVC